MSSAQQQEKSMEDLQKELANALEALQISNEQNAQLEEESLAFRVKAERVARCSDFLFEQQSCELRRAREELREERSRADLMEEELRRIEEEGNENEEEGSQEEDERAQIEDESSSDEESESEEEAPNNIRAFAYGRFMGGVRLLNGLYDLENRRVAARYDW